MSLKKIKNKIIDVASDAMSFPARNKAKNNMKRTDAYVKDKKLVRETKGLEPLNNDYTSPVFRARANVSAYETEYARRMSGK